MASSYGVTSIEFFRSLSVRPCAKGHACGSFFHSPQVKRYKVVQTKQILFIVFGTAKLLGNLVSSNMANMKSMAVLRDLTHVLLDCLKDVQTTEDDKLLLNVLSMANQFSNPNIKKK